jgi:type VI protein secretion system component Hcp
MKRYTFFLLTALVALSFSHPTAFHYYASFKGRKQGQLKAETKSTGGRESQGWIEITSFTTGASNVSTAPGKGGGEGKTSVSSIVIIKKVDAFSPLLNKMFMSSEIIDSLVVQAVDDRKRIARTTVARNGRIKEIKRNGTNEVISITYEQIENKP